MALVGIVGVVIVLLIVGLLSGGGKGGSTDSTSARTDTTARHGTGHRRTAHRTGAKSANAGATVSLSLRATGTLYVCLIGEGAKKLVAGRTLEAGSRTPTFHAKRFALTLGNNSVALTIDGTPRTVPASSGAIGYSITKAGRRPLPPGHLPTCA
jgi:hypothetical protein